ncbi:MAG: GNAT family N-acetyltransferase [Acidimicrobiales bacterium]|nr:GNAT family N-acetyltransferase [Acidimicrobiales bacterium]
MTEEAGLGPAGEPTPLEIGAEDPRSEDVAAMLDAHLAFARGSTPATFAFALEAEQLDRPDVAFVGARQDGRLVGIAALKRIDDGHAELKSMHVRAGQRGHGIGRDMVLHLLELARRRGYGRVSLETGTTDDFRAARALYGRCGFEPSGPFGDYRPSPHNTFMTIDLGDEAPLPRSDR